MRWLPIVGFESLYEVSDTGLVRRIGTDKLKTLVHTKGRVIVMLWKDNGQKAMKVHRAVLAAFVGPQPDGHEGCHNDGNGHNNELSNLRWDTPAHNQADRITHGTSNRGERCGNSKLTAADVLAIRADPRRQQEIAATYGIRDSMVSRIKNKQRWAHL